MKILKIDRKNPFIQVIPQTLEDLWHLHKIIEANDIISGKSTRRHKPKELEGGKSEKRDIFVEIRVKEIDFQKFSKALKIIGTIVSGRPEEVIEIGSHHSITIEPGKTIGIKKQKLFEWQLERLRKAEKESFEKKILLIAMDDEGADFALAREFGIEETTRIASGKQGKQFKNESDEKKYFAEILKKIEEIKPDKTIIAGPGFTKEEFEKYAKEKKPGFHAIFDSISYTGITGFNEIIKRGILNKAIKESQIEKETVLIEKIFEELAKHSGKIAIGFEETNNALIAGAVKELIITDNFLIEKREQANELLEKAETQKIKIFIISSESDAGKKLESISGTAVFLHYKI